MKKERQRYVLFKMIRYSETSLDQKDIIKSIWQSIWRYYGMKEASKFGLWILELNLSDNYGIIRCAHRTKEMLIAALTLIQTVKSENIIISPVKTSGTIRAIKRHVSSLTK